MINNQHTRKCGTFKSKVGNLYCIILQADDQIYPRTIPLSPDAVYDQLKSSQVSMGDLQICDGTTPIDPEQSLKDNPELKDLIIKIQDYKWVTVANQNKIEVDIVSLFENGGAEIGKVLRELFEDPEIYDLDRSEL